MRVQIISAVVFLGVLLAVGEARKNRYDGYRVIDVIPSNQLNQDLLDVLENDIKLGLDFWLRGAINRSTHISVPPQVYKKLTKQLTRAGMKVKVIRENLQELLDKEDYQRARSVSSQSSLDIHNTFLDYDQAMDWLSQFAQDHQSLMKMEVMGVTETDDKRVLPQITISNDGGGTKPTIWIETLTHAREWATLSTILNFIEWLCEGYGSDADATAILDKYDIEINPIANPDGYANSFTVDRFWRKNGKVGRRNCQPYSGSGNGVDLNRNWDSNWNVVGSSNNPCSAVYHGEKAFSEAELSSFVAAMERTPVQLRKAFISVHSYSQMIFVPYGWTTKIEAKNYHEELRVAEAAAEAIRKVRGKIFEVGLPGDLLYNSGGGSYDYTLDALDFEYNFTYELHPDSGGLSGFVLDAREIVPVFEDFKASFIAITNEMH